MGRVTVLLADDDLQILDAFRLCFHGLVDVHTAADGESALNLIEAGVCPDVLVCDYRMPDINGVEVVKRARELLGVEVTAIIASGDTSARLIEESALEQCTVLKKPYTPEALLKIVARANLERAQTEETSKRCASMDTERHKP